MTWRAFIRLLVSLLGLAGVQAEQIPRPDGVSRRAFLKALGVSAAALAVMDVPFALDEPLDLDEHLPSGFDLAQFDSIFKDIYAPAIVAQLNRPNVLMQFMAQEPTAMPPWLTAPVHYARNAS